MHVLKKDNNYINSFTSLSVINTELRHKIWNSATKKQQDLINNMWESERKNPVHAIIYSKNGFLRARLMCAKFINGFNEHYKQIPIFESKFSFIKRVASVIHDYNERLKNAEYLNIGI